MELACLCFLAEQELRARVCVCVCCVCVCVFLAAMPTVEPTRFLVIDSVLFVFPSKTLWKGFLLLSRLWWCSHLCRTLSVFLDFLSLTRNLARMQKEMFSFTNRQKKDKFLFLGVNKILCALNSPACF